MKELTISDLESSGPRGSVWVRNTGAESVLELVGEILITIPGNTGQQAQSLKVPATWLPIDLTTMFPKYRILESTDFRSAVRNGLLTIISDNDAVRLLKQEGAREEQQRLLAIRKTIKEAGAARTISDSKLEVTNNSSNRGDEEENPVEVHGLRDNGINVSKAAKGGLELSDDGLTHSFKMFADKLATEGDIPALNAIRTRTRFSRRELKYLRDNLRNHPKTVAAVKAKLTAMRSKTA